MKFRRYWITYVLFSLTLIAGGFLIYGITDTIVSARSIGRTVAFTQPYPATIRIEQVRRDGWDFKLYGSLEISKPEKAINYEVGTDQTGTTTITWIYDGDTEVISFRPEAIPIPGFKFVGTKFYITRVNVK